MGLFPLRLAQGVERALLDEFLYRLYGMFLAVLAARMAAGRGDQAGHGDSLLPDQPRLRPRNPFPWDDFVGPLPGDAVRNQFLYRLYGMFPAVLAARMAAGHGDSLFPDQPRLRPRNPFPWDDFVGPLPGDAVRNQPHLWPWALPGWRWPQDFVQDLVRWARALAWMPGPAEVSWAELALDYEAFVGRALLASPDHRLRGTRLLLGERA